MLTLSNIVGRLEALEESEYSAIDERLEVWCAMVRWRFFAAQYSDEEEAREALYELPAGDPTRIAADKLMWFIRHFANVLPDVTWKSEKAEIVFAAFIEQGIEENYTESALCCEEAMTDAIQFVAECLQNGSMDSFDEKKRQEAEFWNLRHKYRFEANSGQLSDEGKKWLETFDGDFWQHFNAKGETKPEIKPVRVEAITPALPETLPEVKPEVPKPTNEYVTAHWAGLDENWLCQTADGVLPIFRNREYRLSLQTWQNIESDSYLRQRWHRISDK